MSLDNKKEMPKLLDILEDMDKKINHTTYDRRLYLCNEFKASFLSLCSMEYMSISPESIMNSYPKFKEWIIQQGIRLWKKDGIMGYEMSQSWGIKPEHKIRLFNKFFNKIKRTQIMNNKNLPELIEILERMDVLIKLKFSANHFYLCNVFYLSFNQLIDKYQLICNLDKYQVIDMYPDFSEWIRKNGLRYSKKSGSEEYCIGDEWKTSSKVKISMFNRYLSRKRKECNK